MTGYELWLDFFKNKFVHLGSVLLELSKILLTHLRFLYLELNHMILGLVDVRALNIIVGFGDYLIGIT